MIIGISAFYHDSAVAVVQNGQVIFAAQEERYTRIKQDSSFPVNALQDAVMQCDITTDNLKNIVFYEKPFIRFERILESSLSYAPYGLASYLEAIPIWLSEKLFIKQIIKRKIKKIPGTKKRIPIYFSWHHLSHAASSYFTSPFESSAILSLDGVGEWSSCCIYHGHQKKIKLIKEIRYPNSIGFLYSSFTYFLGFKVNSGEYKVMGLAPFGKKSSAPVSHYKKIIYEHLVQSNEDGSFKLNLEYFRFHLGLNMIHTKKWESLFGIKKRTEGEDIVQCHMDLALSIQEVLEELVIKMAFHIKQITGSRNLCLAGGIALNCVLNTKIKDLGLFDQIHIQPASGDAGGALGAALLSYHLLNPNKEPTKTGMKDCYLGPSYQEQDILECIHKYKATFTKFDHWEELCRIISNKLSMGKIIGWFQGRMEFGPRALGNRSILADARPKEMQSNLNQRIKFRESFRPFAPIVLEDHAPKIFKNGAPSPYMLYIDELLDPHAYPAITHIDGSARLQTVNKESNKKMADLLEAYYQLTQVPLLVNTSFNVRGEPIVNHPEDAFRCFMNSGIDILVMDDYVFYQEKQVMDKAPFKTKYKLD